MYFTLGKVQIISEYLIKLKNKFMLLIDFTLFVFISITKNNMCLFM
jgi:hypothetical protein